MTPPIRTAVLVGSTRPGRIAPIVTSWFVDRARHRTDLDVDVVDLLDADLPARLPRGRDAAVSAFVPRISAAHAFVVVTPEYNHSFPAAVKQAIDVGGSGWAAKPVAFVSYGGRSGGIRAVEQLRQVFVELHAMTIRDAVSLHDVWSTFDRDGRPRRPDGLDAAASAMLDQLVWWSTALRAARDAHPYAA